MGCEECFNDGFIGAVILMAGLHGVLLAAILTFGNNLKSKSNTYLAMSILGIAIILSFESSYYLGGYGSIPEFILNLPIYLRTLIPAGLFYFIIFLIDPNHELTVLEKIGFYAILSEVVIESMYYPASFLSFDEEVVNAYISSVGELLGLVTTIVLLPWCWHKINYYQKYLYDNYSNTYRKSLGWLRYFLVVFCGIALLWLFAFFLSEFGYENYSEGIFLVIMLSLVATLFFTGYYMVLRHDWFQIVPIINLTHEIKSSANKLSSKTDVYHKNLMELMTVEKLFEDMDLTLDRLSERLKISAGYLSQIINEKEQKNFFDFVNFYRVEAVKEKLLDENFSNYTIMGIALESGFKSKSTFNSVFKKNTGYTPSAYRRNQV
ncbi:MAG: helix-turn-helix domain-containing protein [Bacteroidota bacterium]